MPSLQLNLKAVPFTRHRSSRRLTFPAHREFPMSASSSKSTMAIKCSISSTSTDLIGKVREKINGNVDKSLVAPTTTTTTTIDPVNVHSDLSMIDTLQTLGVDRHFKSEINAILEDTYRLWQQKDKDIFDDVTCSAMAFRLLRVQGYEVSSDELAPYADQEHVNPQTSDVTTVLELYRTSQVRINEEETTLEKLHDWTSTFLKQQLESNTIHDKQLHKQVDHYLKNFHGILNRVGIRRCLDLYDKNHYQIVKAADRFPEDFLAFAKQDFIICQAQNRKELEQLQRWYSDCRLDKLGYGRDVQSVANFLTSAIITDPELSEARLAYAKHIILVTRIDDFFDHYGSREESYEILELLKEWKEKPVGDYGSKEVEILFKAVYDTVNEVAEKAYIEQGFSVKHILIGLWVEIITCFKKELDSWSNDAALTLDEYLSFTWVSIGCRICILTSMSFLGLQLSEEVFLSQECTDLCRHLSFVDRLLNDVQTFQKERDENTLNSVGLLQAAHQQEGAITEEEAISKIKDMADVNRRKLMQMVYKSGSIVPRKCKDVFLGTCRIGNYLYSSGDEFTSPQQMMEDIKSLLYEPPTLPALEANNTSDKK